MPIITLICYYEYTGSENLHVKRFNLSSPIELKKGIDKLAQTEDRDNEIRWNGSRGIFVQGEGVQLYLMLSWLEEHWGPLSHISSGSCGFDGHQMYHQYVFHRTAPL